MRRWEIASSTSEPLGHFRVYFSTPGGPVTDVTFFRDAPTTLGSFSTADPFGYAVAQLSFPQIGPMDDLGSGDLSWLTEFANVDIVLLAPDGSTTTVWEGFVASLDWSLSVEAASLSVQCQGALFQVDRYVAAPQFPAAPISYEQLIIEALSPARHPHLRTAELRIEWPENLDSIRYVDSTAGSSGGVTVDPTTGAVIPLGRVGGQPSTVTVGTVPDGQSTGFATRSTGAWEKALTGFVAGLLEVMFTNQFADQWTIRMDPGRQPVLYVRQATRQADYALDIGQPGIASLNLSKDYTQFANVIYGAGTTPEGSVYSRQAVIRNNTRTAYVPYAADPRVHPESGSPMDSSVMRVETHVQFQDGMYEDDALDVAKLMLARNSDPGYTGSLSLAIDPIGGSRFQMRAGEVLKLRYLDGTGERGVNFHIAEVTVNVGEGTVDLKIDSKFRDLITVEEVLARTRDPLTPIKMLQLGKTSEVIPDRAAPWDYAKGSGYVPKSSKSWYDTIPVGETFPFDDQAHRRPPRDDPGAYITVNANAPTRRARWSAPIPIRTAQKGDIRLTQFACYDRYGNRLTIPFHVSIYDTAVTVDNMPYDGAGPSPFIPGAFQRVNEFGLEIPAGTPGATAMGDASLRVGWGDTDQPAGYSPGAKSTGSPLTGLLVDETSWSFDNTDDPDFEKNPAPGYVQLEAALTLYAMFYAEHNDVVYITGRLFRTEPGTT